MHASCWLICIRLVLVLPRREAVRDAFPGKDRKCRPKDFLLNLVNDRLFLHFGHLVDVSVPQVFQARSVLSLPLLVKHKSLKRGLSAPHDFRRSFPFLTRGRRRWGGRRPTPFPAVALFLLLHRLLHLPNNVVLFICITRQNREKRCITRSTRQVETNKKTQK